MALTTGGSKLCATLLFVFALFFCAASSVQAAEKFCTDYGGVIDGDDPLWAAGAPVQITIDDTCTFQNWPKSNPLTTTINFQTNDPSIYLIIFDNVWYDGNMACSNIPHKLWVVNSEEGSFSGTCQDIMIPAETIAKQAPATTATVGLPFTYILTLPSMNYPTGAPSDNDLGAIEVWDDLTATGADLTLVPGGLKAYYKGTSTPVTITPLAGHTDKYLHFALPNIDAGQQVVVEMEVVLEDTSTNVPGAQFTNTATWKFARWIDLDEDGIQDANEYFNPLPGESGISAPMTIVAPNLVVDKFSTATALNLDDTAIFNIDVQNRGGGNAWNPTIEDQIPAGMCDYDPTTTLSARIVDADGVTEVRTLDPVTDYTVTYSGCQLSLSLTDAAGPIAPDQHLRITYQSQLDPASSPTTPIDGTELTNIAGATRWYSADSIQTGRSQFDRSLTDGTPLNSDDHEDSHTVTAALHGYYFEKTAENLTSLENPAITAAPGDTLHYELRVFNVDENINAVTISDPIDLSVFDPATFGNVVIAAGPGYNTSWSFDASTGLFRVEGSPDLNVDVDGELVIEFDVTLRSDLTNGTSVSNQASLGAAGGFAALSDDPRINGVASPDVDGDEDPTVVTIQTPGPLAKANSQPTATIGERFTYTITVPETATAVPLYDVQITDELPANLRFVSAEVVSGGTWALGNSGTGNSLILEDTATGIDIPAGGTAVIAVTVELLNTATNQSGATFFNSAEYTYNRANGVDSTKVSGGAGSTAIMTVVEPDLTATKAVRFVSPAGKLPTDPATVGDILEYVLSIPNDGGSPAYEANIVDTLPANVSLVPDSAIAQINGVDVPGFIVNPTTLPSGALVWGRRNGDGSLDIPAGQILVLTYKVTVVDASSVSSFANSVYVDWTSLDGDYPIDPSDKPFPGRERTGEGCPATTAPNDYCAGPASVSVTTEDNTSIAKLVLDDSYAETPASTTDPIVRVGDTVTYDLRLNLQEYTTQSVVVEDVLPAGMALESFTIDHGTTTFNYTLAVQPAPGATGTLTWDFGDIENVPSGDGTPVDPLVIRYVARVVTDPAPAGVDTAASNSLANTVTLSYTGGDPAVYPGRLTATETLEVRQPQMSAITKVDLLGSSRTGTGTNADPYQVDIVTDVMQFQLSSCNDGRAPAYHVQLTDLLASELDETSITTPEVSVGGAVLTAVTDYTYMPPAGRGGTMSFLLNTPVNPTECVTVDYSIGFHNDLATQTSWSNEARMRQYESLPVDGRLYDSSTDMAQVWMTNLVSVEPLAKSVVSPTSEVTVGEQVVYEITVPGSPANAALDNVVVSDTLHGALEYVSATAALDGAPLAIATVQSGQDLSWNIPSIPAGQQAVITLTTRVTNNDLANSGTSLTNTSSYTYDGIPAGAVTEGSSGALTITEPVVAIGKTVTNVTKPGLGPNAGDILRYSVSFTAGGGAAGDTFSDAFDLWIEDSLSLGLIYVNGTATVNGTGNTIADPAISGDGSTTAQILTWDLSTADIDVPEGTAVTVTYEVRVLDSVVAGQVLNNSARAQWTGLDGDNAFERTGSGTPAFNDYFTGPATTSLIVGDNNSLAKAIIADTYVGASSTGTDKIVRLGDTATYRLILNLDEGTTRSVTVQDVLPAGMAYAGLESITPASGSGPFTYSVVSQPVTGATGTLTWNLGDVVNTPSNDGTPVDALIIEYQATVLPDAGIAQAPTTSLTNTATLGYLDAGGSPVINSTRLVAGDTLTLLQPVMSPIAKLGNGDGNSAATPLNVNVAADTVQFRLESCNTSGLAPAYDVQLTDVLASQLDETSLTAPVVAVGGTVLTAGTGYTYTPPAGRGGTMGFLLNTPVDPGQCVTVDYTVGFHIDFGPNQTWNNSATLDAYWSLPAQSGQSYAPTESSQFYMTNEVSVQPLAKSLLAPTSAEATIGEEAVYQITVPGTAISGALDNVVVSDTLHGALEYVNATATLDGAPLAITTVQSGQDLSWNIPSIPAGRQAVITLTTRVANNDLANGGTSFANTASYTYDGLPAGSVTDGSSGPLTIVEPSVTITKSVSPSTPPVAGDILTYTVGLTAASGANFSSAFDAGVDDTLSLGLAYVAGTARVGGAAVEPTVTGDGLSTPQILTWASDIDITEGTAATITYDVRVLDTVVAGQTLTNSATVQWTGLYGADPYERTGTGTPAYNDYFAGPAATSLTIETPHLTMQKSVDKPIANPGDPLQYTIEIQNPAGIRLENFSLVDDLEGLNASPMFQPASVVNVVVPAGASYVIDGSTLTVNDLSIEPNGSLTIQFEAVLATNLKSGTIVLNQAQLNGPWPTSINSDDPSVAGAENPTRTIIPANGVVYDSASRSPLGGVTLTMMRASNATALPASCFIDPAQQNQITPANGTYKFDLVFDPTNCPEGEDYLIAATAVPAGYVAEPSLIDEPVTSSATAAYSVPVCSNDAIPSTNQCEADVSATVPAETAVAYYLHLSFDSTANQIFNNHIPVDQKIEEKIYISKTSPLINVTRGQIVPYKITVKNTLRSVLPPLGVIDTLPPGFKYVEGSSRLDESSIEPVINGRQLRWDDFDIGYNQEHTIKLLLMVGAGVSEGKYVNQAHVINTDTGEQFSELATATVRVVPDPTFDCTDVIGKVFDDRNLNGFQDEGEQGLGGVRVVTARGLIATTDQHGRFHITCAVVPDEDRGSNFILKLDDRSLPTGYRMTTENPRVQRATRGKMMKFNFGATIHRVVAIDIADGVFEPETTDLRLQWQPKIGQLLDELKKAPSVLRLSYLGDVEGEGLVNRRLKALKEEIADRWERSGGDYRLTVETEVFWRRGRPAK